MDGRPVAQTSWAFPNKAVARVPTTNGLNLLKEKNPRMSATAI